MSARALGILALLMAAAPALLAQSAPAITGQPQSQTVTAGSTVTLSVTATGTPPLSYQWRRGGTDLAGATLASLSLSALTAAEAGSYDVVVANATGSASSAGAALVVTGETPDGIVYSSNGGAVSITDHTGPGGLVTIPSAIAGVPVRTITSLGASPEISHVVVPASVTFVADAAFNSCTGLQAIEVAAESGSYASSGGVLLDRALTTVVRYPAGRNGPWQVPAGVAAIAANAFASARGLSAVTLPAGLTSVGASAFSGCVGLVAIDLPASLTTLGGNVFNGCVALRTCALPAALTSLGASAFSGCSSLTTLAVDPLSASFAAVDGVLYNRTLTRLFCYPSTKIGPFSVPATVTSIEASAFQGARWLTAVSLPAGLTSIGASAFAGCKYLASLTLPEGLTTVGISAFANCETLSTFFLPASVRSLGSGALTGCSSLREIAVDPANPSYASVDGVLFNKALTDLLQYPLARGGPYLVPAGVTSIGSSAFSEAASLTAITLPASLTTLGSAAFNACTGLLAIAVPASVTSISSSAFNGCSSLRAITVDPANPSFLSENGVLLNRARTVLLRCPGGFAGPFVVPETVTSIGANGFSGCGQLTDVRLPAGLLTIGSNAFDGCSSLVQIELPEGLVSLAANSFSNCKQLQSIHLPASLTAIGSNAFSYCNGVSSLTVAAANPAFVAINQVLFDRSGTRLLWCAPSVAGSYRIPAGVTRIETNAFVNCQNLTAISIPSSVVSIGSTAFAYCNQLATLTVDADNPAYLAAGNVLFNRAQTELLIAGKFAGPYTVPATVTVLGAGAFNRCTELTELILPRSLAGTHNGPSTSNLRSLRSIRIDPDNAVFSAVDGVLYDKPQFELLRYPAAAPATSFTVPATVRQVGGWSMDRSTQLTSITLPAGLTSLGSGALYDNSSLVTINLPPSLTTIANDVFNGCSRLASVAIPAGVNSVGSGAFSNCRSLASITVDPLNVRYREMAGNLYDGTLTEVVRICPAGPLGAFSLPSSVRLVAPNALQGCAGITALILPEGLTFLGHRALADLDGLTTLVLPASLLEVSATTAADTASLQSIYALGPAPTLRGAGPFDASPQATVYRLPQATGWTGTFGSRPVQTFSLAVILETAAATVAPGSGCTFGALAIGTGSPTYQWQRDGVPLAGRTGATLALAGLTVADAGTYEVIVSNGTVSRTSSPALLTVTPFPPRITEVTTSGAAEGVSFNARVVAEHFPTRYAASGLPDGLTLHPQTGLITGIPTKAGVYASTLTAASAVGTSATFNLVLTVDPPPAPPTFALQPLSQSSATAGTNLSFTVTALGSPAPTLQWFLNGNAIPGATGTTLTIPHAQASAAGRYWVVATNGSGSTKSAVASFSLTQPGTQGTHATVGNGYVAGQTVTITSTLTSGGPATALGWAVLLPPNWSLAGQTGNTGDRPPAVNATDLLEWSWTTPPSGPVTFSYTLNVPAQATGLHELVALASVRSGMDLQFVATPDPLVLEASLTHSADTDRNFRLNLIELTRVIELYNTRNGADRTGCYSAATVPTEDGFLADPARPAAAAPTFGRFHSADSNRDGRISLLELTRVIELYNHRSGATRSGQYRAQGGTEDGFAAGPI